MAKNAIPGFNSNRAQSYQRLYQHALEQARERAVSGIVSSESGGVKTRVSLDSETVVVNQSNAPIIDEFVHGLVLNDSSHTRLSRQNATLVMRPNDSGGLSVSEKAITYVREGQNGPETPRSTWTRSALAQGEQLSERVFYATLAGGRTVPR